MQQHTPRHRARKSRCNAALIAVTLVVAQASSSAADAAPPPNDQCSGAIVMPGSGPFPLLSPAVDITEATVDGDPFTSCTANDDRVIWFSFTPTTTNTYKISTCGTSAPGSTVDDTVLGIFTSPDCVDFSDEIGCDDDSCVSEQFQSTKTALLTAGTTYFIYASVFGFMEPAPSPPNNMIQVAIEIADPGSPPANDTCAGAEVIPSAGPFPYLTAVTTDVTDATTAGDPPLPTCRFDLDVVSRSVWYKFTPSTTAQYTLSSCEDAPTGSTLDDPVFGVYTSAAGCAGPFTQGLCDEDSCFSEELQAMGTTTLTAGTEYFIVVWKWGPDAPLAGNTALQLRVSQPQAGKLFTVAPCRAVDTRDPDGPRAGPTLSNGVERSFKLTVDLVDDCGVPPTARAVTVNVTAVAPTGGGQVALYPDLASPTNTTVVAFNTGNTRAAQLVVGLAADGTLAVFPTVAGSGEVDLLIDVTGYFE